jgi:Domain of unknown function DUF11
MVMPSWRPAWPGPACPVECWWCRWSAPPSLRARREPGEAFTLAINLKNRSAVEATAVRVEFEVPPGWNITDLTGGTGCERSLASVVCRLDSVTRVAPRAVLVEVVAPEVIGEHKLVARVSSLELDSDPTNNVAELAVDIGERRR